MKESLCLVCAVCAGMFLTTAPAAELRVERRKPLTANVGIVSVGLDAYWKRFFSNWSVEGPTHHFALGIGHHAAELKKLGRALGIETVVVTPETK